MFSFVTKTWNPLTGKCLHDCCYCWVKQLKTRWPNLAQKYSGPVQIDYNVLLASQRFKKDDYVFVCDCTDLFGHWVSDELITRILTQLFDVPSVNHLLLTKNPKRYIEYFKTHDKIRLLFPYLTLGATIESDIHHLSEIEKHLDHPNQDQNVNDLLKVPVRHYRLKDMIKLREQYPRLNLMVSIEPIMGFTENFKDLLLQIKPNFVAVGYNNNRAVKLDEPSLADTEELICQLETAGVMVFRKTLREAIA